MAFDGSGTYNRVHNWVTDRNDGLTIQASRLDEEADDIATALTNCLTKDGQSTPTANITFGGFRGTNFGDATNDTDALNRQTGDARYHPIGIIITTDQAAARFNGTTGVLDNSGVIIDDSDNVLVPATITARSTDAGASDFSALIIDRFSASPAADDIIGSLVFRGRDNAANSTDYALIRGVIKDPIDTSEDSELHFRTATASVVSTSMTLGQGLQLGAPTGGDKGTGTLNATGLYVNNVAIPTISSSDTLTNKTLDNTNTVTLKDTLFTLQDDGDATKQARWQLSGITAGQTRVITVPDSDLTLVGVALTQTLTNKTLSAPVISSIVNSGTLTLPTSTDTLVGRDTTDTLTNKTLGVSNTVTLKDSLFTLQDDGDVTKQAKWQLSGITAGQTRTITVPDFDLTLVGLTNAQTLTNKTLTSPIISTISNTGTLTLPTSTDTLVGRATTDTLTNKTLTAPAMTAPTVTGGLTSSVTDTSTPLTAVSTDAGATSFSGLNIYRNSASPATNDFIGNVAFTGKDNGGNDQVYANIGASIADTTDASEDGRLILRVASAGSILDALTINGSTLQAAFASTINVKAQGFQSYTGAIADDGFTALVPPGVSGVLVISNTGSPSATRPYGIIAFRANAAAAPVTLNWSDATNIAYSTATPTGTTGTDGKLTFSCPGDGSVYVENRLGATVSFTFTFLSS